MEKKIGAILGAIGAAACSGGLVASQAQAAPIASYADLLQPIPNAKEVLQALNQNAARSPSLVEPVQYFYHHHPPPPSYVSSLLRSASLLPPSSSPSPPPLLEGV